MAGLGSLDELYNTFLGQSQEAMNQPEQPWQQELMETVNPDKVRRDNMKLALLRASQAMSATPGNFLHSLAAGLGAGAESYLTNKQDAEDQRVKAMQIVQAAQQNQQDRRLKLLYGAIGVNRDIANDDARNEYYTGRARHLASAGGQGNGGLSANQLRVTKKAILDGVRAKETQIRAAAKQSGDVVDENQLAQTLHDEQMRLEQIYGVTLQAPQEYSPDEYENGGGDGGNTSQFDMMTKPNIPRKANTKQSGGQQGTVTAPQTAIEFLRQNPQYKVQFDAKYGQGAADRVLGN